MSEQPSQTELEQKRQSPDVNAPGGSSLIDDLVTRAMSFAEKSCSRREFLGGWAGRFLENAQDAWEQSATIDPEKRDQLLEHGSAVLALFYVNFMVAMKGSKEELVSYRVESETSLQRLENFQRMCERLAKFEGICERAYELIGDFVDDYEDEFTREEEREDINGTPESVDVVEIPNKLKNLGLDSSDIKGVRDIFRVLSARSSLGLDDAQKDDALVVSRHEKIKKGLKYKAHDERSVGKQIAWLSTHSLLTLAFMYYDKLGEVTDSWLGFMAGEEVPRRTVLKAGGVVGGSMVARWVQGKIKSANEGLLEELKREHLYILRTLDSADQSIFERFYDHSMPEVIMSLESLIQRFAQAIRQVEFNAILDSENNSSWKNVRPRMSQLKADLQRLLEDLNEFFSHNPNQTDMSDLTPDPDLKILLENLWAAKEIEKVTESKSAPAVWAPFLSAGAFGGVLLASLLGEFAIQESALRD